MSHSFPSRFFGIALLLASSGCVDAPGPTAPDQATIDALTVTSQPGTPTQSATMGVTNLGLATPRDGWMYVPNSYDPATPAPLLVLLHGAGGSAADWSTDLLRLLADNNGVVLLAIDSRYPTWDIMQIGRYEPDVEFLNDALAFVFDRVRIDPTRVTLGGFSDGANEALGVGIANAGLFRRIFAFSPSAMFTPFSRGAPAAFVAHGTQDPIVDYSNTANALIPRMLSMGMDVQFASFHGGHTVPDDILVEAFAWMLEP